jgi:hypothetical protein
VLIFVSSYPASSKNRAADVMKKTCHRHLKDLLHGLPAFALKAQKVTSTVTCIKYKSFDLQGFFSASAHVPLQYPGFPKKCN